MKKKLLLGLGLLVLPFMTYANDATFQYALINTSASTIPNPIKVTAGYISYYFQAADGSQCPNYNNPAKIDLSKISGLPLPIYLGTESKFTFAVEPAYQNCLGQYNIIATLYIAQVDGINKQDGVCAAMDAAFNEPTYVNMNIEKTTDNFYCSIVNLKK